METNLLTASVPIVQQEEDGAIRPNPLFHRPFNKLHSRCIEYPFAASRLVSRGRILDLGSAKADPFWLSLLGACPAVVVFTDIEPPTAPRPRFVVADCRRLPFADASFDVVTAISLIEHIGLLSPQASSPGGISYSIDGDLETLAECSRILAPGGRLVLTIPMGCRGGYTPCASARVYTKADIARFSSVLEPEVLDYYEYQLNAGDGFRPPDYARPFGRATWRRIPLDSATARNQENMDGILCSTWKKKGGQ